MGVAPGYAESVTTLRASGQRRTNRLAAGRLLAAAALIAALTGCDVTLDDPPPNAAPDTSQTPGFETAPAFETASVEKTVFMYVVDGDTIETLEGTVRIIGIDSPERGECGYSEASEAIDDYFEVGDDILLQLPVGQNDRDKYDRLLRYVVTADGRDLGMLQVEAGHAIARYDSRDGYPAHPLEDAYHAAQIATTSSGGSVITTLCTNVEGDSVAPPAPEPAPDSGAPSTGPDPSHWWIEYSSCAKLKRNTVGHPTGPFDVNNPEHALLYDWFANQTGNRGDGDGDGLACE